MTARPITSVPEWRAVTPVELVQVATSDGIPLVGVLQRPAPDAAPALGIDLVLCINGSGGGFWDNPMFAQYGEPLCDEGCAQLRINTRGQGIVTGVARWRQGAAYEVIDDCRRDLKAWIDFAEDAGFRSIALWGHSLGALKALYYASRETDPRVRCVIASSPPRWNFDAYASMKEAAVFQEDFARVKRLIEDGRGDTLVEIKVPVETLVAARVWMEKYGPGARYDVLDCIPASTPVLVSLENVSSPGFRGLDQAFEKIAAERELVTFHRVGGVSHYYGDHRQQVWNAVTAWLSRVMGVPPVAQAARQPHPIDKDRLSSFAGTYKNDVAEFRFEMRDGVLFHTLVLMGREKPPKPVLEVCADDAVLIGDVDGQRVQFLEREGRIYCAVIGTLVLAKIG